MITMSIGLKVEDLEHPVTMAGNFLSCIWSCAIYGAKIDSKLGKRRSVHSRCRIQVI